jgi:hypothetical protein
MFASFYERKMKKIEIGRQGDNKTAICRPLDIYIRCIVLK